MHTHEFSQLDNWIDTAAVYGPGHSEEVVARALAEWSGPQPYVFTKCGMIWNDRRGWRGRMTHILKSGEEKMKGSL